MLLQYAGIIAVTNLQIVEWHNYKHLDWITVRKDDEKLYKFKEGDFYRLRIQDIEDMILLLDSMQVDKSHSALDVRLKGIRMMYLPRLSGDKEHRDKEEL
ncbi:hypothetical protein Tco_0964970 [Tanacetum coccineum]